MVAANSRVARLPTVVIARVPRPDPLSDALLDALDVRHVTNGYYKSRSRRQLPCSDARVGKALVRVRRTSVLRNLRGLKCLSAQRNTGVSRGHHERVIVEIARLNFSVGLAEVVFAVRSF